MKAQATALINAPIGHAWKVLADHEGMATWAPGGRVTLTNEGSSDRNGVGAVRKVKVGPATLVEEIERFEPEHALGYKAIAGVPFKNWHGLVTLEAEGDKTRATWTLTADARLPYGEQHVVKVIAKTLISLYARAASR